MDQTQYFGGTPSEMLFVLLSASLLKCAGGRFLGRIYKLRRHKSIHGWKWDSDPVGARITQPSLSPPGRTKLETPPGRRERAGEDSV